VLRPATRVGVPGRCEARVYQSGRAGTRLPPVRTCSPQPPLSDMANSWHFGEHGRKAATSAGVGRKRHLVSNHVSGRDWRPIILAFEGEPRPCLHARVRHYQPPESAQLATTNTPAASQGERSTELTGGTKCGSKCAQMRLDLKVVSPNSPYAKEALASEAYHAWSRASSPRSSSAVELHRSHPAVTHAPRSYEMYHRVIDRCEDSQRKWYRGGARIGPIGHQPPLSVS
jgi:hypothetical protein